MATLDTIKTILEEVLSIDPATVTEEATFESLNIDSLDMLQLICEFEDRTGLNLGEPEGIANLGDLVNYIDSL